MSLMKWNIGLLESYVWSTYDTSLIDNPWRKILVLSSVRVCFMFLIFFIFTFFPPPHFSWFTRKLGTNWSICFFRSFTLVDFSLLALDSPHATVVLLLIPFLTPSFMWTTEEPCWFKKFFYCFISKRAYREERINKIKDFAENKNKEKKNVGEKKIPGRAVMKTFEDKHTRKVPDACSILKFSKETWSTAVSL